MCPDAHDIFDAIPADARKKGEYAVVNNIRSKVIAAVQKPGGILPASTHAIRIIDEDDMLRTSVGEIIHDLELIDMITLPITFVVLGYTIGSITLTGTAALC